MVSGGGERSKWADQCPARSPLSSAWSSANANALGSFLLYLAWNHTSAGQRENVPYLRSLPINLQFLTDTGDQFLISTVGWSSASQCPISKRITFVLTHVSEYSPLAWKEAFVTNNDYAHATVISPNDTNELLLPGSRVGNIEHGKTAEP